MSDDGKVYMADVSGQKIDDMILLLTARAQSWLRTDNLERTMFPRDQGYTIRWSIRD